MTHRLRIEKMISFLSTFN